MIPKRCSHVFKASLLCLLFLFASPMVVIAGGARLALDMQVLDAGSVMEGEVLTHSFPFRNLGDQVLEIKDVRSD